MENNKTNELFKNRGLSACMIASLNNFSNHFKTTIKRTWIPTLLFSLITGLCTLIFFPPYTILSYLTTHHTQSLILNIFCYLLIACSFIWMFSSAMNTLNGNGLMFNIKRTAIVTLHNIILAIIISIIIAVIIFALGKKMYVIDLNQIRSNWIVYSSVAVLLWLVLLPYIYVMMKYYMETETNLFKQYFTMLGTGISYWPYTFIVSFISLIIIIVSACIILTPFALLIIAQTVSQNGISEGDPSGLPSIFTWLLTITSTISAFILSYIFIWRLQTMYYIYGSITTQKKEKEIEIKNNYETAHPIH